MEEWKECKLGEVTIPVRDRIETSCLDSSSYISTENMLPNKAGVTLSSGIPAGNAIKFNKGDVLISNIRPYFRKIWRADKVGGCSADVICLRASNEIEPLFLYYLLSQDLFFDYVMQGAKGTKMPRGDKNQIMQWSILIPSITLQKKISSILSSIDEKIKINRRINENLEQQAQALFKSWFVDFEPFRDGEFVESELGMIPKGWKVQEAQEIFEINIGKTPPRKEQEWFTKNSEDNVWVSIADMGSCGMFISDSSEYLTNEAIKRFNIQMIEKDSVLLSFKLTVGRVAIAHTRLTTNEAIARFILPQSYYREFIYLYLKQYKYGNLGSTSSIATAVNSKTIKGMRLLIPPSNVISNFSKSAKPLFDKIALLLKESRRLAELRDTLLPRLMSGEIKVDDVTL